MMVFLKRLFGLAFVALIVAIGAGYMILSMSLPTLEGEFPTAGLSAPVTVTRDANGVPTIRAATRADASYALGHIHAQERFFQMDLQRRSAAGELSGLLGEVTLKVDRRNRLHRFRMRAKRVVAALTADERPMFDAYSRGVADGLYALGTKPFEYWILNASPKPWADEDFALTTYAMYLTLQSGSHSYEENLGLLNETLGPDMANFIAPLGTRWDSPVDRGTLPEVAIPGALTVGAADNPGGIEDEMIPGSNNWVIDGAHSTTGAAIVANDMHLGLNVPNIWYRARIIVDAIDLDITGVTLPGTPFVIVGSNGHVAWGFTNSMVDTTDLVLIDWVDEAAGTYQTPDGIATIETVTEEICVKGGPCEQMIIRETIWGPILPGSDALGRTRASRWIAHDEGALNTGMGQIEAARTVDDVIAVAHAAGMPTQNIVIGDKTGRIAITYAGPVPDRFGHDGLLPTSWADGTRGWHGRLTSADTPLVRDPADGRLWSANARVYSGDMLKRAGHGHYALGARGMQIRDRLFEKDRMSEKDLLAIQLDDEGRFLVPWQKLLADYLEGPGGKGRAALTSAVKNWGGRAVPQSVGYRVVRRVRSHIVTRVQSSLMAPVKDLFPDRFPWLPRHSEGPAWRLMEARPAHLIPAGMNSWDDVIEAAVRDTEAEITEAGGLQAYTWGEVTRLQIRHPLSRAVPGLGLLTDTPSIPIAGERGNMPRINSGGYGASERIVVSPGHEATGIFEMPSGQSGNPLSPYFNKGHRDWVEGRASPFLPGKTRWTLTFTRDAARYVD